MNNFDKWVSQFLSTNELERYQKLCSEFTTQFWEDYADKWQQMFKKVEKHLTLDPKSKEAKKLYDEWMSLVNKAYKNYPDLQEKIWEMYKSNLQNGMNYFNQKVIDFIDQVSKFYKK